MSAVSPLFYFRHLCVYLDPKAVYCTLADIISAEADFSFASLMVRELNTILFSSVELFQLRVELQSMQGHVSTGRLYILQPWVTILLILVVLWLHYALFTG